eukprot:3548746-Rhodomonas_salina.2
MHTPEHSAGVMAFHVSTTVLERCEHGLGITCAQPATCETARLVTAGGSESVRGTTEAGMCGGHISAGHRKQDAEADA